MGGFKGHRWDELQYSYRVFWPIYKNAFVTTCFSLTFSARIISLPFDPDPDHANTCFHFSRGRTVRRQAAVQAADLPTQDTWMSAP